MTVLVLPWFVPAFLAKGATKVLTLLSFAFGIALSKVGLHAPLNLDWAYGANAAHQSAAYVMDDNYQIVEARAAWTAAGTDGGAVTLTIEKLTGTQAPGAGANMFGANTFNLKGAANTANRLVSSSLTGLSTAQKAAQLVAPGDRISATLAGTLTTLTGLTVRVVLKRTRIASNNVR